YNLHYFLTVFITSIKYLIPFLGLVTIMDKWKYTSLLNIATIIIINLLYGIRDSKSFKVNPAKVPNTIDPMNIFTVSINPPSSDKSILIEDPHKDNNKELIIISKEIITSRFSMISCLLKYTQI